MRAESVDGTLLEVRRRHSTGEQCSFPFKCFCGVFVASDSQQGLPYGSPSKPRYSL